MAFQLELSDGTTTIDLSSASGFCSATGYHWQVSEPTGDGSIPEYLIDVVPVYVYITNDNGLAATMQSLHALQLRCAEYWRDPNQGTPVWFTRQLAAESSETQTLVRRLQFEPSDEPVGSWTDDMWLIADGRWGTLTITHHPYNEASSATTAAGAAIACNGGTKTISSVPGDVNARISEIRITPSGGALPLEWPSGIFVGVRSQAKNNITLANVVTRWECESGAMGTDAAVVAGEVHVNFAGDTSMVTRLTLKMSQFVGGNYTDNYGAFLVVLIGNLSAAGTANAQMVVAGGGTYSSTLSVAQEPVQITGTSAESYVLGTATFPVVGRQSTTSSYAPNEDAIIIQAEQYSGTPTLEMDYVVLIPIDEAWATVTATGGGLVSIANTDEYEFGVRPNDAHTPWYHLSSTGLLHYALMPSVSEGFGLRPGDNKIVLCGHDTSNVTMAVDYVPRWVSLRGAE